MRKTLLFSVLVVAAAAWIAVPASAAQANLVLINLDAGTGVGLDDPTPVAPVGGNPGTTLGQQRVNVYEFAMSRWESVLESDAPVFIGATFTPLFCTSNSAVLGAAGATFVFRDFPGAAFPLTWYGSALADARAGFDLNPGFIDIISFFNSDIDDNDPSCLTGRTWYYGFDNNEAADIDFLTVVMHEIGHGLNFQNFANEGTGTLLAGLPDIYTRFQFDLDQGKTWAEMTVAERQASGVNALRMVWNGPSVTAAAPGVLAGRAQVDADDVGTFEGQRAAFGPSLDDDSDVEGDIVLVDDGAGVATDACEPIANDLSGAIALIDRGSCSFASKVANAQAAGAVGALIANNQPKGLPSMGGSDPSIVIPSLGISRDSGDALKTALLGGGGDSDSDSDVEGELEIAEIARAGMEGGFVRLYAPDPVAPGSSGSHWDTTPTPNLLMEPFINTDLESAVNVDLTPNLFSDVGWTVNFPPATGGDDDSD